MSDGITFSMPDLLDDIAQVRRRVHALRLCATAIELEGDKKTGQGLREIVEIVSDDLGEIIEHLEASRRKPEPDAEAA